MTPIHWEHSWNYFCRKLKARGESRGRIADAIVRLSAGHDVARHQTTAAISASRCAAARTSVSSRARAAMSMTSICRARRGAPSCAARTLMRASARSTTEAASRMPGVLLTLTADDWEQGRTRRTDRRASDAVRRRPADELRAAAGLRARQGASRRRYRRRGDRARRALQPRMAAEAVAVDYEPLPAVTTTRDAVAAGAPLVHPEFGSNLVFEIERGDRDKTEAALAAAAKVVELHLTNSRLSANPMEPRAYLCDYDAAARPLHALCDQPAAALSAPLALGLHAAHPRAQNPRRSRPMSAAASASKAFSPPRCRPWSGRRSSCAGR